MTEEQVTGDSGQDAGEDRWPIGFMLLVGATALYLGWRLIQGVVLLVSWMAG